MYLLLRMPLSLVTLILLVNVAYCWKNYFPRKTVEAAAGGDPGDPLFLTPYIESGDIDTARKLSFVGSVPKYSGTLQSYSGYLTVNKEYGSNIFFWFFLAENQPETSPVVLWLQGGPGASSLFGLFAENGPFYLDSNGNLQPREYSWTKMSNVLYFDNPVGTGFSFTNSEDGYARNESDVARDLLVAVTQFFTLFSEYQKNEFYLTGESYAGKYVPGLAYAIHVAKSDNVNLAGIALGNAFIDPETMNQNYGQMLYQYGLLDESERDYVQQQCTLGTLYILQRDWMSAFYLFDRLLDGDKYPYPAFLLNATGCTDYYNFVQCTEPALSDFSVLFDDDFRKAIHVGPLPFNDGSKVESYLLSDIHQSAKWQLIELLNSGLYRVLIYNGQLDIICGLPLTEYMLHTMDWKYAAEYRAAPKRSWKVSKTDNDVAGYVRSVNTTLLQVAVRGAGHMVPGDQPRAAFDLLFRFVYKLGFD